jgi:hypothetical protein
VILSGVLGMGKVFADSQEEPHVALAVLDFHFLAGNPLHANALLLFKLLHLGLWSLAPPQRGNT